MEGKGYEKALAVTLVTFLQVLEVVASTVSTTPSITWEDGIDVKLLAIPIREASVPLDEMKLMYIRYRGFFQAVSIGSIFSLATNAACQRVITETPEGQTRQQGCLWEKASLGRLVGQAEISDEKAQDCQRRGISAVDSAVTVSSSAIETAVMPFDEKETAEVVMFTMTTV